MCSRMAGSDGDTPLNADEILAQASELASEGYRVLAVATGDTNIPDSESSSAQLIGLTFIGLVAMSDPPRREAKDADPGKTFVSV